MAAITGLNDQQAWRVAGKWNFGRWLLAGYWDQAKYKFQGNQIPSNVAVPLTYKYQNWSIGGQYFMGPWTFGAQYNWRNNGLASAYNGTTNTYNPQFVNLTPLEPGRRPARRADHGLLALEAHDAALVRRLDGERRHAGRQLYTAARTSRMADSSVWALSAGLWHTF